MSKRLFVAIDVPAETVESLAAIPPPIKGLRWMSQLHLSVGFFGSVDGVTEAKLRAGLEAISFRTFFLPLIGVGSFAAKESPSVIWIGVGRGHPHLFQLHKRVQEAALRAGLEPDLRAFHPHVTVARCRGVTKQMLQPFLKSHVEFDAGMFRVAGFHLFSSRPSVEGSIYTREVTIPASL